MKEIKIYRKQKTVSLLKKYSKRWFIDAFTGMAQGLFVTLIAGTIVKTLGQLIGEDVFFGKLLITLGSVASTLMGAGIGAGIARYLKAPNMVVFAAMVAGTVGAWAPQITETTWFAGGSAAIMPFGAPGNPIGAYLCALIAIEVSKLYAGKTKLDILLVPLLMILTALAAAYVALPVIWLVNKIGEGINLAVVLEPISMGIIVSVAVGILLTMPTSSAAICVALGISGLAGGAAVVGCACQMVGFAVLSYKENRVSGLISQGLGTSMLQIPNIFKNPRVFIPPIVASAIAGPIATAVFGLQCTPSGAGMGTSGLVGIIGTVDASLSGDYGTVLSVGMLVGGIIVCFFLIPIAVCALMGWWFRKMKWIKNGDLSLNYEN